MHDPLRSLTEELADRQAATPGERRASRWLVDALRRSTHQVWVEPFGSFPSARPAWAMILGLALVGGVLVRTLPGLGLSLTLLAAVSFAAQALGWLELGWLSPICESQNVVGVIPADAEIRQRVVVVAHYDTGEQTWPRPVFVGVTIAVIALPLAAMASVVLPGTIWDLCLLLPLTGVAVGLIHLLRPGPAYGNSAGVAAALAIGQGAPLRHTEVWTLFTGSRIPGLVGIQAFLRRHDRLLQDGYFVVLEEADGGGATLWQRRGEASVIAERGHRAVALLRVNRANIAGVASRVRAMAEEIDQEAQQAEDCGTLPL